MSTAGRPGIGPTPAPALRGLRAYSPPKHLAPVDLILAGNEGDQPDPDLLRGIADQAQELLRRYPKPARLEAALAARLGVAPEQVFVGAGGDEVIDRLCRVYLTPERRMVLPEPTFVMFAHYAALTGAVIDRVPWRDGPYPLDAVLAEVRPETALITVVTPNNPTGAVATRDDLQRLSEAAPHALLVVDLAYAEYCDDDLTAAALALPNAVVVRTLSKAWGLAGLRVGYGLGPSALLEPLRAAGGPFAVSGLSLALAQRALDGDERSARHIAAVRDERQRLQALLRELGADAPDSQGNFVLARLNEGTRADEVWLRDGLAGLGIAVRIFPGDEALRGAARITCPGDAAQFARLCAALRATLRPQAVLFDMDGVLADVSGSYREAIRATAAAFGAQVTADDVKAVKAAGDANNDWVVTQRLLARRGIEVSLDDVTARFEQLYQGTETQPGLHENETLLPARAVLEQLAARVPLGIVTGRPRGDAQRFLDRQGLGPLFHAVVCLEDGPLKPDPAPVRAALTQLGVDSAWLIGDTPDDVRAARAAGVVPLGVCPPGEATRDTAETLLRAGAARVLDHVDQILELYP